MPAISVQKHKCHDHSSSFQCHSVSCNIAASGKTPKPIWIELVKVECKNVLYFDVNMLNHTYNLRDIYHPPKSCETSVALCKAIPLFSVISTKTY